MQRVADIIASLEKCNHDVLVRHRPFANCGDKVATGWCRVMQVKEAISCLRSSDFVEGEWTWLDECHVVAAVALSGGSWRGTAIPKLLCTIDPDRPAEPIIHVAAETSGNVLRIESASGAWIEPLHVGCGLAALLQFYDHLTDGKAAACTDSGARIPVELEPLGADILVAAAAQGIGGGAGHWSRLVARTASLWTQAPMLKGGIVEATDVKIWRPGDKAVDLWSTALALGIPAAATLEEEDKGGKHTHGVVDDAVAAEATRWLRAMGEAEDGIKLLGRSADLLRAARTHGLRIFPLGEYSWVPSPTMVSLVALAAGAAFYEDEGPPSPDVDFFLRCETQLARLRRRRGALVLTSENDIMQLDDLVEQSRTLLVSCHLSPTDRILVEAMTTGRNLPSRLPHFTDSLHLDNDVAQGLAACLDAGQKHFVLSAGRSIAFLTGPPGSGRTTALAHAVAAIVASSRTALVVAPRIDDLTCAFGYCCSEPLVLSSDDEHDTHTLAFLAAKVSKAEQLQREVQPADKIRRETATASASPLLRSGLEQAASQARDEAVAVLRQRLDEKAAAAVTKCTRSPAFKALRIFASRGEHPKGTAKSLAERFARTTGWAQLLTAACPVVLATPPAVARWLSEEDEVGVFDVLALDDADSISAAEVAAVSTRTNWARGAHAIMAVAGRQLLDCAWMRLLEPVKPPVNLTMSYGGLSGLPFALDDMRITDFCAEAGLERWTSRVFIRKQSGGWPARRVGSTLDGVAKLLATCRRDARHELPADVLEKSCYGGDRIATSFRALRGATVRAGMAGAALETVRAASRAIKADLAAERRLSLCVACADTSQARLLEILIAAEDSPFDRIDVRPAKDFRRAAPGACDLVLLDSLPSKYDKSVCAVLAEAARLACVIFSSTNALPQLTESPPPPPPNPWVVDLFRRARHNTLMQDSSRLVAVVADLYGIANYDIIVLCHSNEAPTQDDVAVAAALRRCFGWRRVLHLCQPPKHANYDKIAAGIVADLCSWRHSLDFGVVLVDEDRFMATIKVTSSEGVPRRVLDALRVQVVPQPLPWQRSIATKIVALSRRLDDSLVFEAKSAALPIGGSRYIFELREPTIAAPIATTSIFARAAPPHPPKVAKVHIERNRVVIVVRIRGARAAPWNDTYVDVDCTLKGEDDEVISSARYTSTHDDEKLASIMLSPPVLTSSQRFHVTCWATNSAGSSRAQVVANNLELPAEDSGPFSGHSNEDDIVGAVCDDGDSCIEQGEVERYDDDSTFFNGDYGGGEFVNGADIAPCQFGMRLQSGLVIFDLGAQDYDKTIEFEAARWRTDAPESETERFTIRADKLLDGNSTCELRNLVALLAPSEETRGTLFLRVRARLADVWTAPPTVIAFDWENRATMATARIVDAWLEGEHDSSVGDATLRVSLRFSFPNSEVAQSLLQCAAHVSAEIVLSLGEDEESVDMCVKHFVRPAVSAVATFDLSPACRDMTFWYRAAMLSPSFRLLRFRAVCNSDDSASPMFELPVPSLQPPLPQTDEIHPLALDAAQRLFSAKQLETIADIALAVRHVAEQCLCAERIAVLGSDMPSGVEDPKIQGLAQTFAQHLRGIAQVDNNGDVFIGRIVLEQRGDATRCRPIAESLSSCYAKWLSPFGSLESAVRHVLRAAKQQAPNLKTVAAYVSWLFSEDLAPETCTFSVRTLVSPCINDAGSIIAPLDPLLCDVTHDANWTPSRDRWCHWLTLGTENSDVADALARAILGSSEEAPVEALINNIGATAQSKNARFRFTMENSDFNETTMSLGTEAALCFFEQSRPTVVMWIAPVRVKGRAKLEVNPVASLRLFLDGMPFMNPAYTPDLRARGDLINWAHDQKKVVALYRGVDVPLWELSPRLNILRLHDVRKRASRAYAAVFGPEAGLTEEVRENDSETTVALASVSDATQRRAVSNVMSGRSFVCRGPPGTGKSSTIANAALALAAAGKTVLVVGQEEAAVRVVASKIQVVASASKLTRRSFICANAEDVLSVHKSRDLSFAEDENEGDIAFLFDYNAEARSFVDTWSKVRDSKRLPPRSFAASSVLGIAEDSESRWCLFRDSYQPGAIEQRVISECSKGAGRQSSATPRPPEVLIEGGDDNGLETLVTILHRGRMRDGSPREWRYVCEMCGERRASAMAARRHVIKHQKVGARQTGPQRTKKKSKRELAADVASEQLACRMAELEVWQLESKSPSSLWERKVCGESVCRVESAIKALNRCDSAQRGALERLATADRAERDTVISLVGAERSTLRDIAAVCLEAVSFLDESRLSFVLNIAAPFAVAASEEEEAESLLSLARLLAAEDVDDEEDETSVGVAAALAALERLRRSSENLSVTKAAADVLYNASQPDRTRLSSLLVACVQIGALLSTEGNGAKIAADAPHASADLVEAAQARRMASLGLIGARADARLFEQLRQGSSMLPPILCATPTSARKLGVLEAGTFDIVFIDEASQMRTRDAVALTAAGSTALVVAGDDQQLPPRQKLSSVSSSTSRGLLDDALDFGRLRLVPLEWHYRSSHPSLIAVSNSLFYGSRLVAPLAAPRRATNVSATGLVPVLTDGPMESDRGPPAGLVNRAQAVAVVRDAADVVAHADAEHSSVSLGVVTLNRPQRGLIYQLLLSDQRARLEPHPEQRGALRRRRDDDRDSKVLERDPPIFVESIDNVQGEEREIVLFSTLLAPRSAAALSVKKANKRYCRSEQDAASLGAAWDALEEVTSSSGSDDDGRTISRSRRARRAGSSIRHYSTLTHAHGHRLLNVGITRAISTMRCYVHPACPAPPPHDDRPGRRAFGWLVRALLGRASPCSCGSCQDLNHQLLRLCDGRRIAAAPSFRNFVNGKENLVDQFDTVKKCDREESTCAGRLDDEPRHEAHSTAPRRRDARFCRAVLRCLRREARPDVRRIIPLAATGRHTVDFAVIDSLGHNVAVLASPRSEHSSDWLDFYDSMPQALLQPKLGWRRVTRLEPSKVLQWIVCPQDDVCTPLDKRIVAAIDRISQEATSFASIIFGAEDLSQSQTAQEDDAKVFNGYEWLAGELGDQSGLTSVKAENVDPRNESDAKADAPIAKRKSSMPFTASGGQVDSTLSVSGDNSLELRSPTHSKDSMAEDALPCEAPYRMIDAPARNQATVTAASRCLFFNGKQQHGIGAPHTEDLSDVPTHSDSVGSLADFIQEDSSDDPGSDDGDAKPSPAFELSSPVRISFTSSEQLTPQNLSSDDVDIDTRAAPSTTATRRRVIQIEEGDY